MGGRAGRRYRCRRGTPLTGRRTTVRRDRRGRAGAATALLLALGWTLVGDAGCHKDPFLALGICDAFRDAELLAHALGAISSGEQSERDALAEYERRRNTATLPDYRRYIHVASGQPLPSDVLETRARVHGDAEATRSYFLGGEGRLD